MKPYGLSRYSDLASPDKADIRHYALKTSKGKHPGPGGDTRSSQKSKAKQQTRRLIKKAHRSKIKHSIRKDMSDLD